VKALHARATQRVVARRLAIRRALAARQAVTGQTRVRAQRALRVLAQPSLGRRAWARRRRTRRATGTARKKTSSRCPSRPWGTSPQSALGTSSRDLPRSSLARKAGMLSRFPSSTCRPGSRRSWLLQRQTDSDPACMGRRSDCLRLRSCLLGKRSWEVEVPSRTWNARSRSVSRDPAGRAVRAERAISARARVLARWAVSASGERGARSKGPGLASAAH
jgi:hypothetical protein